MSFVNASRSSVTTPTALNAAATFPTISNVIASLQAISNLPLASSMAALGNSFILHMVISIFLVV